VCFYLNQFLHANVSFFSGFVCTTYRSIASFQAIFPWFVYIMCCLFFVTFYICDWFHCCTSSLLMASWHLNFLTEFRCRDSRLGGGYPLKAVSKVIILLSLHVVCSSEVLFWFHCFWSHVEIKIVKLYFLCSLLWILNQVSVLASVGWLGSVNLCHIW